MKLFKLSHSLSIVFSALLFLSIQAQETAPVKVSWSQCFGGYDDDDIFTAKATPDSGMIMGGLSKSSDGDLHKNNGDYDWWMLKIDKNKDTVFSVSYGGSEYDKCRYAIGNEDGTSMAFGSIHSLYDGDLDTSQIVDTALCAWWLLKLDVQGKIIYQKAYNGNGLHGGRSMLQTADGGYLLCGWSTSDNNMFSGNYGSYDTYLMKVDKNGNMQWIKNYGGSESDRCRSVIQTNDGGYVFNGGSYSNDHDFAGQNKGLRDMMVVKVDSLGNTLWSRLYGGKSMEHAFGLSLDWDGNILVCGEDSLDSGGDCNGLNGAYDGWAIKINQANGDTMWTLNLGESEYEVMMRFLSLPDKGYIALLSTNSSDGLLSGKSLGHGDIWLVRLDSNRNVIWSQTFGGSMGETANDIQIFDTGYLVWGLTASQDGDVLGHHVTGTNDFNKDVWAFFIVDSTLFESYTASLSTDFNKHQDFDFNIYPSPNNGSFDLQIKSIDKEALQLEIYNSIGQIIGGIKIPYQGNSITKKFNLPEGGIYNITIRNEFEQKTKKVMVQN
jgi:hypothetical protein